MKEQGAVITKFPIHNLTIIYGSRQFCEWEEASFVSKNKEENEKAYSNFNIQLKGWLNDLPTKETELGTKITN